MNDFVPGSVEHRKKVADMYHLDEQEVLDLPKREFKNFCAGIKIGEKSGAEKLVENMLIEPKMVIDILKQMSEENLNEVLDEFCEPVKKEPFICTCATCKYKDTSLKEEPCHTCNESDPMFSLWIEGGEDGSEEG
jgi:hypothetical protein